MANLDCWSGSMVDLLRFGVGLGKRTGTRGKIPSLYLDLIEFLNQIMKMKE